ncbi:uncharacterized protein J3D65DRAFT_664065 [Phyllosticta citribraziliensis]|uniref:Uncharacterized protein n=1 Tax=Phyllosticta citribraziliensis TaxID=989973 RepID=A0ABR1MBP4_9PEZI
MAAARGYPIPTPNLQYVDYAFNVFGYAMKIPDGVEKRGSSINAYEFDGCNWKEKLAEARAQGQDVYRKTFDFTPRELSDEVDARVEKYFVVGLTYSKIPRHVLKLHPAQKPRHPVGNVLHDEAIIGASDSQIPTLVVAPEVRKSGGPSTLFGLLCPREGLCQPIPIQRRSVFYLIHYRDDATTFKKRELAWNKLIQRYQTLRRPKKAKLQPAPEKAAEEPQPVPPVQKDVMHSFIDNNEGGWEDGDSGSFAREFHQKWPEAPTFSNEDISLVKRQLVDQEIIIEPRLLRPFVIQVMTWLRDLRSYGVDVGRVAQQAIDQIRVLFGAGTNE